MAFGWAFVASLLVTPLAKRLAFRWGAVDKPDKRRKLHNKPTPRLGGIAIIAGWLLPLLFFVKLDRPLLGLLGGLLILLAVGIIDDIRGLSAPTKLIWQFMAAGVVLAGGLGIIYISNPLGGAIALDGWRIPLELFGFNFNLIPLANFVSLLWIVGMINAVNLLDGLDGLAGGVSAIAALVLFIMAITPGMAHATVAILAIGLLGSLMGFLPYNFYPSRIFMGDSGAYVIGLILAVLSIYSGSKITVGALVLGLAVVDMVWVFARRISKGQSPFKSDRGHLHHRILDSGLVSHRRAVLIIYLITILVAVTIFVIGGTAAFVLLILLLVAISSVIRILAPTGSRRL